MSATYSLRLTNASGQPWTFFVYQAPLRPDGRIRSLVWIASPCTVAVDAHTTLMWNDQLNFVWCAHSGADTPMHFRAGGKHRVDRTSTHGVLFNLDNNAPSFQPCSDGLAPGAMTVTVAANVPNSTYAIGTAMDGAGTLVTSALLAQSYDFTAGLWIGAGQGDAAGSALDLGVPGPRAAVRFPPNVYALSYTLDQQEQWRPTGDASPSHH